MVSIQRSAIGLFHHPSIIAMWLVLFLMVGLRDARGQWIVSINGSAQIESTIGSSQLGFFELAMNPFIVEPPLTMSPPLLFLPIYSQPKSILGTFLEEGDQAIPSQYGLRQTYPNPFNPSTIIRFDVPRASEVKLEVFDILGRRIATLLDGAMTPGSHEIVFDAGNLSSGQYLVRMQAGRFIEVQSITLMK